MLASIAAVFLAIAVPAGATTGYGVWDGVLWALELETGALARVAETGGGCFVSALAAAPEGGLYAAVSCDGSIRLLRLDRATGAVTAIGFLGFSEARDLAAGDAGELWYTNQAGLLLALDPATGQQTPVPVAGVAPLAALAYGRGALYAVRNGHELVTVDPDSGSLTAMVDLVAGTDTLTPTALTFDHTGGLWALVYDPFGFCCPFLATSSVYRVDPASGAAARVFELYSFAPEEPLFFALAAARGPFDRPFDVPTLGAAGLTALVLALALLATAMLKRQRYGTGTLAGAPGTSRTSLGTR